MSERKSGGGNGKAGSGVEESEGAPEVRGYGRLRADTLVKPKGGYTTYSYDAAWEDRSGNLIRIRFMMRSM